MRDRAQKQKLLKESNRVLTNYFSGKMNKLSQSIIDRLQFSIQNGNASDNVAVVIATANFDTDGFTFDGTAGTVTKHHHNLAQLAAAGYAGDVILDDPCTVSVTSSKGTTANVVFDSATGKFVSQCREHLKVNPRYIKRITIAASDNTGNALPDAFNASMFVASVNPFQKEAAREIDLSQYFMPSQYQDGKIVIDYDYGNFQWNDMLYWAIEVRRSTVLKVTVDFYAEED